MLSILRFLLASALLAIGPGAAAATAAESHVVMISIDGLGAGEMFSGPTCVAPHSTIRALAGKGAYARGVSGVLPTITYPSHATLSTGTNPARHGVIDNGIRGEWFKQRSQIAVDTLWDAARKAGKSVAIVTWPSTYGADADYLVPEDLANFSVPIDDIRRGSTPGLFDSLAAAVGEPALMPFTHPEAGVPLDEMTSKFAAEVVRRHKPGLLLAHFLDYDHRMHHAPWSQEACRSLERIDAWIAHILEAYRSAGILDRTTVFVVSDHGFVEVKKVVSLFAMLLDAGWEELFPGEEVSGAFEVKYAGGSAAFYPGRMTSPALLARVAGQLRPRIENKYRHAVRWISPGQARVLGGFPGAVFTLCAQPGYSVTGLPPSQREVFVEPAKYRGAHGYCPDQPEMNGIFIASGFGVRRAGVIGRMALEDVAPTVASFLSVKLPQATGRDLSSRLRAR